jgi:hypothetical protein
MAKWWESPEYVAAEKELSRASWLTVCYVNAGNLEERIQQEKA